MVRRAVFRGVVVALSLASAAAWVGSAPAEGPPAGATPGADKPAWGQGGPGAGPGGGRPPGGPGPTWGRMGRPGPPGPPLPRVLERHAERLGLGAETLEKVQRIAEASREKGEPLRARLQAMHGEMRRLLEQTEPSEEAVMRQAEEIGRAETDLQKHRLRTMLEIRAQLTPEQRQELVKIYREMRERRGKLGPPRAGPRGSLPSGPGPLGPGPGTPPSPGAP